MADEKHKNKVNFWRTMPRPFFVLAPMANVTDSVFRRLFAKYGRPDVTWTEFVSADGLMSPGRERLLIDLEYSESERPIVAQLFTGHPDAMRGASALAASLGFDGVDINMGCPDRSVEKQGGGAAMMKDLKNAIAVIEAAREGASRRQITKEIPVSIKIRIGYNKPQLEEWIGGLLALRPHLPALTVHLRTRKEMSDVPAHWEMMPEIVRMRDDIQADIDPMDRTLIIGNGDVGSLDDARVKAELSGCDGVMVGRGIFGTPWFFEKLTKASKLRKTAVTSDKGVKAGVTRSLPASLDADQKSPEERMKILLEHTKLFEKTYGEITRGKSTRPHLKNFATMKKHFKAYISGWDGAKDLRAKLMETESVREVENIIKNVLF